MPGYFVDVVSGQMLRYAGEIGRLSSGKKHDDDLIHTRTMNGHTWTVRRQRLRNPMPGEVRQAVRRRRHIGTVP